MTERLLKPSDIAEICQVSTKTVMRAIRRGELSASRLGSRGAYRISEEHLALWIEQRRVTLTPKTVADQPISLTRIPMLQGTSTGTLILE